MAGRAIVAIVGAVAALSCGSTQASADLTNSRVLRGHVEEHGHVYVEVGQKRIDGRRFRVYKTRFRHVRMQCSDGSTREASFGATEVIRQDSQYRRTLSSGADAKGPNSRHGWEYQGAVKHWSRAVGTVRAYEVDWGGSRRVVCRSGLLRWTVTT